MKIQLIENWKKWIHFHTVQWSLAGVTVGSFFALAANTASITYSIKMLGLFGTISVRWMIFSIVVFPAIASGVRIIYQPAIAVEPKPKDTPSVTIATDKGDGK